MSVAQKQNNDSLQEISWTVVSGVQPLVYVAREGERPVGVIEMRPTAGYRVTTCTGIAVGDFPTLLEGQDALERYVADGRA